MDHYSNIGQPTDLRDTFAEPRNRFLLPKAVSRAADGSLALGWQTAGLVQRTAFNCTTTRLDEARTWDFPNAYGGKAYDLPLTITPLDERSIRIQMDLRRHGGTRQDPDILRHLPQTPSTAWSTEEAEGETRWVGPFGSLVLRHEPWQMELFDAAGRSCWRSWSQPEAKADSLHDRHGTPTLAVRRDGDHSWLGCWSWQLVPGEVLVGGGEAFGRLDKRGQVLHWFTSDAHGSQAQGMYKPVPFLMSNQGYGVLFNTTASISADLGSSYHGAASAHVDDDRLDVVLFLGAPGEILGSYTGLSGRSPVPPLWSFGLWMSRITYDNEAQVREVASRLRKERIPCDVIHLDTGWFEHDWCCDYRFSTSRFDDAALMLQDLHAEGFTTSLWQLPYYTPINPLFPEVQDGLAITDDAGGLPTGDAIADFSNPKTVLWYQEKLRPLLQMGVGAIKVDFGEGAPENGRYHSGQSGRLEHNRYPMRYQEAAFSVTEAETGGSVIWARAAWAGCQRYPIHWGGDAESTDQGLASSLQGGLSLGLCGFSFWSHDAGGFTKRPDADLYLRWLGAGVLGSHLRTHGQPPREPWTYGDTAFTDTFRELVELRYTLLPYIWAQAARCAEQGQPLMRAMLLDSPDLPESWPIDDQFRLGEDLLVIPLLRPGQTERRAWLPPGGWVDWFSGTVIDASGWQTLPVGSVPVLLLARRGSTIPIVPVAQHSGAIDWSALSYRRFPDAAGQSTGWQRGPDEATATVIPPT